MYFYHFSLWFHHLLYFLENLKILNTIENKNTLSEKDKLSEESSEIYQFPQQRFKELNNTEVVAQVGSMAHLHCTVLYMGDGTVSLTRQSSYEFLILNA